MAILLRNRNPIRPLTLRAGDTVRIISPSWCGAGLFPNRLQQGCRALSKLGLRVEISEHALKIDEHRAGTGLQRATDINDAFASSHVSAIFCAIGGNYCNHLLQYIDFELIKKNPKIIMGYSDITVLLASIFTKTSLVTFYGPTVMSSLAEFPKPFSETMHSFELELFGGVRAQGKIPPSTRWTDEYIDWADDANRFRERVRQRNTGYSTIRPGNAIGPLIGGCLPSLLQLKGTEYWPDLHGSVLVLEMPSEDYTAAHLDSDLGILDLVGTFDKISAVVVGRFSGQLRRECQLCERLLEEWTARRSLPVLAGIDFGHSEPMITLPLGTMARVDAGKQEFELLEPGCSAGDRGD